MVGVLGHQPFLDYGPSSAEAKKSFYFFISKFYMLPYFYNASGEINSETFATGSMIQCPDYLTFGLNSYSRSIDLYFYKTSNIREGQMVFNDVSMYFEGNNGVQLNSESKSISCKITQYSQSPNSNPDAGTFEASVNNKGNINITLTSTAWDSNSLFYNNTLCRAVIKAKEFTNGKIYIDCYYA